MAQDTDLILCKNIPIDNTYKDVLNFSSSKMLEQIQREKYLIATFSNYSFIQPYDSTIKLQIPFSTAQQINYIAFRNKSYYAKWYFAFVTNVKFISPDVSEITYQIDLWTTWFDQFELKNCMILRQHVGDDTIGKWTTPEDISVPDVMSEQVYVDAQLLMSKYVVVATNWRPDSKTGYAGITLYNKNIFGSTLAFFPANSIADLTQLYYFILQTGADGHAEDISEIFIVPSIVVSTSDLEKHDYDVVIGGSKQATASYWTISNNAPNNFNPSEKIFSVPKKKNFSDYTPKNNKCLCYPYNYLLASNCVGGTNIYRYEDFTQNANDCEFIYQFALSVGCSGRAVPKDYKGIVHAIDEALPFAKFPTCAWSTDSYINWLTQNAVNHEIAHTKMNITATKGIYNAIGNGLNGDIVGLGNTAIGTTESLFDQMSSLLGDFYQASLLPNIVSGQASGDVNFADNTNSMVFYQMRCKTEYLKQIDDYFSRFGYKWNRITLPELNTRLNWNYVQTGAGEIAVEGEIPQEAKTVINNIFSRGVTVWHYINNVGNFHIANPIV